MTFHVPICSFALWGCGLPLKANLRFVVRVIIVIAALILLIVLFVGRALSISLPEWHHRDTREKGNTNLSSSITQTHQTSSDLGVRMEPKSGCGPLDRNCKLRVCSYVSEILHASASSCRIGNTLKSQGSQIGGTHGDKEMSPGEY